MMTARRASASTASRRGRLAACAAARPPAGAPGRRDALLGASAAAVATVQLPGLLVPAAAQAIVSGYTPDDGTTTTVTAFHDTPNAAKVRWRSCPAPRASPPGAEGTQASSWRTRFHSSSSSSSSSSSAPAQQTDAPAQWYKDVFSGARAAVDAGELGDGMASTFRWLIASEVGGDGVMVTAVMPKGNAKAFEDFYNPKVS